MSTPHYFHVYDVPEFNDRYGYDEVFTYRCDAVAQYIYQVLEREVRLLRQIPSDCFSPPLWDICDCASKLMDRIPHDGYTLDDSFFIEALQLLKIAYRFIEYSIVAGESRDKLQSLIYFVNHGAYTSTLGAVS